MGYLRDAEESDVDLLFQWANDESVRKNSFSTQDISYNDHVKWFKNVLSFKNIRQFIFIHDGEPVGQIRMSLQGQEAEIGYSVCKEKRQMGFGKEMLFLLTQKVKQDYPQLKKLTAKVKPDNIASQKAFLDMGYDLKYYNFEIDLQ